jgi:hypothetical protein
VKDIPSSPILILDPMKGPDSQVLFFLVTSGGVKLSPLGTSDRVINDECGAVGRMKISKANRSTWRKLTLVSLCPRQIPHDVTWAQTRAAAVESWRLLLLLVGCDFRYCGHYWPIVPAPGDR